MPGVRFQEVRSLVSMAQVLDLLGFVAHEASRDEVRGLVARCMARRCRRAAASQPTSRRGSTAASDAGRQAISWTSTQPPPSKASMPPRSTCVAGLGVRFPGSRQNEYRQESKWLLTAAKTVVKATCHPRLGSVTFPLRQHEREK